MGVPTAAGEGRFIQLSKKVGECFGLGKLTKDTDILQG